MRTLRLFVLGFAGGVVVFLMITSLPWRPSARATHPLDPPQRLADLHPNEGGAAWYSLCTGGDELTRWIWAYGPEIWEDGLDPPPFFQGMRFWESSTICNTQNYIDVIFQWEYAILCDLERAIACYIPLVYSWHGDHWDIVRSTMLYDYAKYMGLRNHDWRSNVSAHEWGHAMSLDDHTELLQCGQAPPLPLWIMGYWLDNQDVACVLEPHFDELCSSINAYGYDPDADCLRNGAEASYGTNPQNPDTDADGCADGEEVGPNKSLGGQRDPLNYYDFYDITNITMVIGANDRVVSVFDLQMVLLWGGAYEGGPPNSNGKDYDDDGNGNAIPDGQEIDYAGATGFATGPDGAISVFDLQQVLNEGGDSCVAAP